MPTPSSSSGKAEATVTVTLPLLALTRFWPVSVSTVNPCSSREPPPPVSAWSWCPTG